MNVDWLVGFLEGEGSFVIAFAKTKTKFGYQIIPLFEITQAGETKENKTLFEDIQKFLANYGIRSNIYFSIVKEVITPQKIRIASYKHFKFVVYGIKNCLKLVDLLKDVEWYSKKRKDFDVFSEILNIQLVNYPKGLTEDNLKKIVSIKLKNYNPYRKGRVPIHLLKLADKFGLEYMHKTESRNVAEKKVI